MPEQFLVQFKEYGIAGMFIAYLIYDRQVLLKKLVQAIEGLTKAINKSNA